MDRFTPLGFTALLIQEQRWINMRGLTTLNNCNTTVYYSDTVRNM